MSISYAQNYTISGFISDKSSGEKLIGATIYNTKTLKGTTSNEYGFYSVTLPTGEIDVAFSFVGFRKQFLNVNLTEDKIINVELSPSLELQTVEINASRGEQIEQRTEMSTVEIPVKQLEVIPTLMGERDVLKVIQLLPGVQSGSEGSSGFYVRGGGPDQNLILLDGVPVYNASHLFGFFSVFNSDAINNVKLVKGGFPARYGGRLSSVLDIRMKEGNSKEFKGSGSIGLVSSKLTLEGPIWKDRTSFIISARRTYIDILAQPFIRAAARASGSEASGGYFFYDVNAKLNHKINDKHRLFLSAYTGKDKAYAKDSYDYYYNQVDYEEKFEAGLDWGNLTTAIRWNYLINKKLFANTTLTYSKYQFGVGEESSSTSNRNDTISSSTYNYEYLSGIEDFGGKIDFDFIPSPNHYFKFGLSDIYHTFTPGVNVFQSNETNSEQNIDTTFGASKIYSHEIDAYIEDDFRIGSRLKVNAGLHYSRFINSNVVNYRFQPRISARFMLADDLSMKASYATMTQFLHLLTNSTIGLPTDLWVPSTRKVDPQYSEQIAFGFAKTLSKHNLEISVEGYYKWMENLIEYREGASFFSLGRNWDDQITQGDGWSYGGEFLLQKKEGKTTGWIGYTLSWTRRQFKELNFGEPYDYKYDRRHDISIVITHELKENIDIGLVWVYGTGNALTLSNTKYYGKGFNTTPSYYYNPGYQDIAESYQGRNEFRMPAYHRLDLSANFKKEKKRGIRTHSVGFYNTYNRRNPFFIYFQDDERGSQARMFSLFPVIPFYAYNFKF